MTTTFSMPSIKSKVTIHFTHGFSRVYRIEAIEGDEIVATWVQTIRRTGTSYVHSARIRVADIREITPA